jgi:hypothetical protein
VVLEEKVRRRFQHKFQDATVPCRETIHKTVNELTQTGIILDIKTKSKYQELTEEKLNEISAMIGYTSQKSLRCLA